MSYRFCFGASGAGKSYTLHREVIGRSGGSPGAGHFIVLVPEQYTMQTQKEMVLASPGRGIMDIDVSGSSRLNAIPFNTDAITGELSGSSDADVTVCNRIAVSVSGASDLTYGTSSPDCRPEYRCTTSGSSSVTPR